MTSPMPWIKIYTEILDDCKFGLLPDHLKWRFIEICCVAGECDAEGYLVKGDEPMAIEDLAWRLRKQPDELLADMEILEQREFLAREDDAWLVINFSKRQGRRQSEKRAMWRERKRRQREREAEEQDDGHDDVTRESRESPCPREEKRREERGESESHDDVTRDDDWLKETRIRGPDSPGVLPNHKIPTDPLEHLLEYAQSETQNWADPAGAGGYDEFALDPVDAFCEIIKLPISQLTESERSNMASDLRELAKKVRAGPEAMATAIRLLPSSQYSWKFKGDQVGYSSTAQKGFQQDLKNVLKQYQAGNIQDGKAVVVKGL